MDIDGKEISFYSRYNLAYSVMQVRRLISQEWPDMVIEEIEYPNFFAYENGESRDKWDLGVDLSGNMIHVIFDEEPSHCRITLVVNEGLELVADRVRMFFREGCHEHF